MTIEAAGEWQKGSEAADLKPFLEAYEAGGQPVTKVAPVACACGSTRLEIAVSDDEDAVRSRCASCGAEALLLDSASRWDDEQEPDECACPCEGEVFEAAVGLAQRPDGAVTWVAVGLRCVECGILGAYADWQVDGAPAAALLASG